MKILIYGGGTIGVSYGWILSARNDISIFSEKEKAEKAREGFNLTMNDFRFKGNGEVRETPYLPKIATVITDDFDLIIVAVNRYQLKNVLPNLVGFNNDILFLQNNWDIKSEISQYLSEKQCMIGFPSQIGGGREGTDITVNIYKKGTILGEVNGEDSSRLSMYKSNFEECGFKVEIKDNILDWLKVHYLQQSITAGIIIKMGDYTKFSRSTKAMKEMVLAFREGITLCESYGIDIEKISSTKMFDYPVPIAAFILKRIFNNPKTKEMITNHMKEGFLEWIVGYYEVLESGIMQNIDMPVWSSYKPYVDEYIKNNNIVLPQ